MCYSTAFQMNAPERVLNIPFEILDHFTYSFKTSLMAQTYFLSQMSLKTCIIFPFSPDGLKYLFIYLFNRADSSSWVLFFYLWTKIINGLTGFCLFVYLFVWSYMKMCRLLTYTVCCWRYQVAVLTSEGCYCGNWRSGGGFNTSSKGGDGEGRRRWECKRVHSIQLKILDSAAAAMMVHVCRSFLCSLPSPPLWSCTSPVIILSFSTECVRPLRRF